MTTQPQAFPYRCEFCGTHSFTYSKDLDAHQVECRAAQRESARQDAQRARECPLCGTECPACKPGGTGSLDDCECACI